MASKANEGALLKEFLLEYSKLGSRLWRNNVGKAWTGIRTGPVKETQTITIYRGDMVLRKARPFHAGLAKGSSDLIGFTSVQITPNMVGKNIAVFTACEVKTGKLKATKEQAAFVSTTNKLGGIGVVARKFDDLLTAVKQFKAGE